MSRVIGHVLAKVNAMRHFDRHYGISFNTPVDALNREDAGDDAARFTFAREMRRTVVSLD